MTLELFLSAGGGAVLTVAGMALRSFVSGEARKTADERFKELIRAELAVFKGDLIRELNGTYKRSGECALIERQNNDRLAAIESQAKETERYVHQRMHDMANAMQVALPRYEQ